MKETQIKALCEVLTVFTHSQIDSFLAECNIQNMAKKSISNGYYYSYGDSKINKLTKSLSCCNDNTIYGFIEHIVSPNLYTDMSKRDGYHNLIEELNKVLLFDGKSINAQGEIITVNQANTLDEVDRRVNSLSKKMYERKIHGEVQKYCNKELLKKDYFDAVFEASKGLAERVRNITGLLMVQSCLKQLFQKTIHIYFLMD